MLGLIGVFPIMFGFAILTMIILFDGSHFISIETTLFTFTYMMQGDTFYDTGVQSRMICEWFSWIFYIVF